MVILKWIKIESREIRMKGLGQDHLNDPETLTRIIIEDTLVKNMKIIDMVDKIKVIMEEMIARNQPIMITIIGKIINTKQESDKILKMTQLQPVIL